MQQNVDPKDEDRVTIILKQFNFTCSTFTSVMMLKLQLQDYLFNMSIVDGTNKTKTELSKILNTLVHLQTAAAILNNIAVRFSPYSYSY